MMKIRDLTINASVVITLVVKSAVARETKAKKPYMQLELYDGTDTISGNYWDWTSGNIPAPNSILDITAQVTEWQGAKQLNIRSMKTNTAYTLNDFMPSSTYNVSDIFKNSYELISAVKDETLRTIALSALEELQVKWLEVPGAKGVHHAYIGGTLIHSYETARLAKAIAEEIPEANLDLCIVGGMLHDIGKLYTYALNGVTIDMTDEGKLFDHSFIGAEFIGNFAESHLSVDDPRVSAKLELLRHIILSHHGQLEFGAAVPPQCIEALIVSHADGLSASIEQVRTAAVKAPDMMWTDRIYTLNNRSMVTPAYISDLFKHA